MKILNTKIEEYIHSHEEEYKNWLKYNDYGGIHIKILEYLKDIEYGFFVEVGAYDGIFQSNTLILENLGWDGLLIEASINLYKKCVLNRNCSIENYALVPLDYKNKTIKIVNDISLVDRNSIVLMGDTNDINDCPVITFKKLCDKHNIKKVDVFFLDVEGFEPEVLNGIDFKNVDITFFVIEINSKLIPFDVSIVGWDSFMLDKGYYNISNISNFNYTNCPNWSGDHQDYLYKKIK